MRFFTHTAIAFGLLASMASAQIPMKANYGRGNWLFAGGYSDKRLSDNSWKVSGSIGGSKPYYLSEKVALYRAAELTEAAGYKFVRIDKHKGTHLVSTGAYFGSAGASVELVITGVNGPDATGHCETSITMLCATFATDQAKIEMSPYLNFKAPH